MTHDRVGEVFWVYPFMTNLDDPKFPRSFECKISVEPVQGWLRVEVQDEKIVPPQGESKND